VLGVLQSFPGLLSPSVLTSFVVLVLSLSFHEAAHAWTADRLGDPTARQLGRLTLNPLAHIDWIGTVLFPLIALYSHVPLIGWAKPVPVQVRNLQSPRRDFAIVALAGPVSNLILAVVAGALLEIVHMVGSSESGSMLEGALTLAVMLNVLLAVFNMIPVPPLDGGNVLAGFAPEPIARLIYALRPYGFLILYGLLLTGVVGAIAGPVEDMIARWLLP
jgi:Zn-dependent protease